MEEKMLEKMICATTKQFEKEDELWECQSTKGRNHSRYGLCRCDMQLHLWWGACQATAWGTQLHGGDSTQKHKSGFRCCVSAVVPILSSLCCCSLYLGMHLSSFYSINWILKAFLYLLIPSRSLWLLENNAENKKVSDRFESGSLLGSLSPAYVAWC